MPTPDQIEPTPEDADLPEDQLDEVDETEEEDEDEEDLDDEDLESIADDTEA